MSLSDLASLGSFVSGLAVLASLVFLYFQLRQLGAQVAQAMRNQQASIRQGRAAVQSQQACGDSRTVNPIPTRALAWILRKRMTHYLTRRGRIDDARQLQDVERAAGKLFRTVGMPEIADDEPTSIAHFESRAREGGLLVAATEAGDEPVGFLYWSDRDGCAYTEELSVDPAHSGFRLGARLLDALATEVGGRIKTLTLATFRDVPWNAPYYARLGFEECDCAALGPGHVAEWQRQADHGLDMTRRIFMRRSIK